MLYLRLKIPALVCSGANYTLVEGYLHSTQLHPSNYKYNNEEEKMYKNIIKLKLSLIKTVNIGSCSRTYYV